MKHIVLGLVLSLTSLSAMAQQDLVLANSAWAPFIIDGEQQGTSEQLVCQALQRAGHRCQVEVKVWETVLDEARVGSIDGIAAAWHTEERAEYLLFSDPYLTNRIVTLVNNERPIDIKRAADLIGLKVAMIKGFAYGDDIEAMVPDIRPLWAESSLEALMMVRTRQADIVVVDDLVARNTIDENMLGGLIIQETVLAFRDLHFAVPRSHPHAEQLIADFHTAYESMLDDGTVNEILDLDWLATDFGHKGRTDIVMRSGVNLDQLDNPWDTGSVYGMDQGDYRTVRSNNLQKMENINWQVEGKSHSSLQSALNSVFGENTVCTHTEYRSEFDCSELLKKFRVD